MKKNKKERKPVDTTKISGGTEYNSAERRPALSSPGNEICSDPKCK